MKAIESSPAGDSNNNLYRDYITKTGAGSRLGNKSNSGIKLSAGLACLQFSFAIYATFLLYYLSPTVDPIITGPERASWMTQQWSRLLPQRSGRQPEALHGRSVCQWEEIGFSQKISNDSHMVAIKTGLFREVMEFQQRTRGCETLDELMDLPSTSYNAKVTVVLNHFQRKTLCAQLDALLEQTVPFHNVWVVAFGSPNEAALRATVEAYNHSRISFISSSYDFKYYGRFQMALQAEGADFVYIMDDDMIPGKRMLEILSHVAGTDKYHNSVLGSIGRILPFRQKDFTFPSYRKFGSKEAGLYLPDPAYNIVVDRVVQVDFLSSSWFLSTHLIKTLFIETPFTFRTGEDLHLSYQLQKYRDASTFVLPVDPNNKDTWGDSEHRLAQVAETTVIHRDIIQVRDDQWWRAISRGYRTQWAAMHPQQSDVFFYAHTLSEVEALAPLVVKFRSMPGKKAYMVVTGGSHCPCEDAARLLGWTTASCHDRRFKIFDLEVGSIAKGNIDFPIIQEVFVSMRGLLQIHSPALVITVDDIACSVHDALTLAVSHSNTLLVQLPRAVVPHALWMAEVRTSALQFWNKMKIQVTIITQNRSGSLMRLLQSLMNAHYLGDDISLTFNMDSKVDIATLHVINSFVWPHGSKMLRRRIIQGGLIRAVSESWYPASDDDFGLLLEDDIEVSPFYYMWLKYAVLSYHYDPTVQLPELNSIALYTPRVVEVVRERPHWNATNFFKLIHPNMPYLHQLPCSWGALFFPKHWRQFYKYMGTRFTEDAKENPVQIPRSRTNGWQASWKKFLIDMMYLRGHVTLYPNFPNQTSFSTNHMEPGAHIAAADNVVTHHKEDFEVPLLQENFLSLLPGGRLPPASKLPVLNLFNQPTTLRGLKSAGAKLAQDVIACNKTSIINADDVTGDPLGCVMF
ncbi:unnamed protein product [Sphagnum jensenii]|uniref:Glycosyltransferase family protein 2 n=1 Tax=Sphagnum jensenii TaxID=128206 RepID=A0ABP1ABM6_9BRYO